MPNDVHPQIQSILDRTVELGIPKLHDLSTEAARKLVEQLSAARRESYPSKEVAQVINTSTGPGYGHVPVRIYRASEQDNCPAMVFYHGGGHVVGSLETYDTAARLLAHTTGCTVISVDYRMGPEHPFPAAVEDSYDATRWVAANAANLGIDADRLVVCGDSAGGNLAAVVALLARDKKEFSIAAQVLIYPVIDYRGGTPSYERFGEGYGLLETETVTWFMQRYLEEPTHAEDWRASPCFAGSHEGLPDCFILLAECDVLRDEGIAYATQLRGANVYVEQVEYKGMIHGFFTMLGLVDDAERTYVEIKGFLDKVL